MRIKYRVQMCLTLGTFYEVPLCNYKYIRKYLGLINMEAPESMEWDPETEEASSEEMSDEPLIQEEPFEVDWPGVPQIKRERMEEEPPYLVAPEDLPLEQLASYPPNVIDDVLMNLDPLRTQRACRMPAIAQRCNPEFWRQKMYRLDKTPRQPYTIGGYGRMAMEAGYGCAYTDPLNDRDCILDALAKKDLDRFRYYMENSQRDFPGSTIVGWFAYFAGPGFFLAWSGTQSLLRYKILLAQIYAATGRDKLFYDIFVQDRDLWKISTALVTIAAMSGSTAILRYIFENVNVRPFLDHVFGLNEPVANQRFSRVIDRAAVGGHRSAAQYLRQQARKVGPMPAMHEVGYVTTPMMSRGRYVWSIGAPIA